MARTIGNKTVLPDLPPSPRMHKFPNKVLTRDTLPAFNAMGQGIVAAGPRPAPTIVHEAEVDYSGVNRINYAEMVPNTIVHGVTETFGGDPRFEVNRATISMPTNPRRLFKAPSVNVQPIVNKMSLRQAPILPRANLPQPLDVTKFIPPSNGVRMEAEYVAPPVNLGHFRGLAPNRFRQLGINAGRTFGAEGHLL